MSITDFLLARIGEDEAAARDRPIDAHIHQSGCYYYNYSLDANWFCDCDEDGKASASVLAECAAKRAIVERHPIHAYRSHKGEDVPECAIGDGFPCDTLQALAAVYADHPDYDSEWA